MDDTSNELKATFEYSYGDIFEVESDVLINPVNCKGVSGAGLAKAFKAKFPTCQKKYEETCKREMMITDPTGVRRKVPAFRPGDVMHFIEVNKDKIPGEIPEMTTEEIEILLEQRQHIVFFPTKNHWKRPSRYEYVESGMESLANLLTKPGFESATKVSIPALGCGLGGLEWDRVEEIIRDKLGGIEKTFILFPPQ